MPEQARAELLAEAEKLRAGMADLTEAFAGTQRFARRTRDMARVLAGVVVILFLMVVALAITTVRANNANDKATRLGEYQVANCEATNVTRAADKAFWGDILSVIAPANGTPGQKAFAAKIQPKVDARYAPRDCSVVDEGKVR